jgi:hypothetical protein
MPKRLHMNVPVFKHIIRMCRTYQCLKCKHLAFTTLRNIDYIYHPRKEKDTWRMRRQRTA